MPTTAYKPQVTRRILHSLCRQLMRADSLDSAAQIVRRFAKRRRRRSAWYRDLCKLAQAFETRTAMFAVFTEGNSKLPFYSFSSLPQYSCPGAGECLKWCYSFTSWRYPAAFARQAQNAMFLRFAPEIVAIHWRRLPDSTIVRLYVDGDFSRTADLAFWFSLLSDRPDIQAYGYSKSLHLLAEWARNGLPFPQNYRLNISSGSRFDGTDLAVIVPFNWPITRGVFQCVPIRGRYAKGFARFDDSDYHREVRESARQVTGQLRVFSCPGQCGACLPSGEHACGSDRMRLVTIAAGEHS